MEEEVMGDVTVSLFWCGGGGVRRKNFMFLQGYLVLPTRPSDRYGMKIKTFG